VIKTGMYRFAGSGVWDAIQVYKGGNEGNEKNISRFKIKSRAFIGTGFYIKDNILITIILITIILITIITITFVLHFVTYYF